MIFPWHLFNKVHAARLYGVKYGVEQVVHIFSFVYFILFGEGGGGAGVSAATATGQILTARSCPALAELKLGVWCIPDFLCPLSFS